MSTQTRVRWTGEERTLIVQRMAHLLNKSGVRYSKVGLVIAAQETLLQPRRRKIFTPKELKDMNAKAHSLAANSIKEMIVEAEAAVVEHAVIPQRDELATLLESLIDKIADRVADKLSDLIIANSAMRVTHGHRHNPEPPCNAPREPKVGVLILGMQPHQGNILKQEFPMLDITCYDSDEARTKQVIMRKHTIGMTRFLSHQVEDRYRKCPRYHRHSAGTSELKTLLKQIAEGTV